MRLMKIALLAVAGLGLGTAVAQAETWHVTEGPNGKITGVWNVTITDGVVTGNAAMLTAEHKPLTYALSGKIDGTAYRVDRVLPSDNNLCTYTATVPPLPGLKKATEINGSAMCQQKTGMWKVRITTAK